MKIGEILRYKQPGAYKVLNEKPNKNCRYRRDKKEHLSFSYCRDMMEEGHVYKRTKGGAWRQVK